MMSPTQRQRLVDNLTMWRHIRLRIAGHPTPYLDADVVSTINSVNIHRAIYGYAVVDVMWQQRPKTEAELMWELFPQPGMVWVPVLTHRTNVA